MSKEQDISGICGYPHMRFQINSTCLAIPALIDKHVAICNSFSANMSFVEGVKKKKEKIETERVDSVQRVHQTR